MSLITQRDHKYAYNGQEQIKELGINITEMTWRQYDNALGRFHGIDKLAAMTPNMTPYHFENNNPIVFSDPSGLAATIGMGHQQNMLDRLATSTNGDFGRNGGFGNLGDFGSRGGGGGNPYIVSGNSSNSTGSSSSDNNDGSNSLLSMIGAATDDSGNIIKNALWINQGDHFLSALGVVDPSSGGHFLTLGEWGEMSGIELAQITVNASRSRRGSDNSSTIASGSIGAGSLTLGAITHNLNRLASSGKFRHSNGQVFKQGYRGGRWHTKAGIAASKGKFNSAVKFASRLGNSLTVASAGITVYDGLTNSNGWQNHHTADLAVTGILYAVALSNPLGWVVGGGYFVADMITIGVTGQSITENLFD